MFNLKKKLNAIMPGEGTRGALQNVLTVDWSGHKTVLVEVPGSGASRSNEVEMNGMGEGDYGRLIDDDEDEIYQQNRGHFNQPRHRGQFIDEVPPPLPPKPVSSSSSYASSQQYATHDRRQKSKNPFALAEEDSSTGFEPRELSKPHHKSYDGYAGRQRDLLSFEDDAPRGWSTFSEPSRGNQAALDPWAGRGWGTGNGQGQTSPTSSTGSGTSTVPSAEDPFRN